MAQAAVDLGAHRHFYQVVIHIAIYHCLLGEHETLTAVNVALNFSIDRRMGHLDFTRHAAAGYDAQHSVTRTSLNGPDDRPFNVELTSKDDVPLNGGFR